MARRKRPRVTLERCADCGHGARDHGIDRWHCSLCGPRSRVHRYKRERYEGTVEEVKL